MIVMIVIMIMQGRDTFLLLLVNLCIPHQNNSTVCPSYINYCLKRKHFVSALLLAMFNPLWIKNFKRTSAIKVTTMKVMENFWKPSHANHRIDNFCVKQKWRRSPWRMHCMHSGMAKSTTRAHWTVKKSSP